MRVVSAGETSGGHIKIRKTDQEGVGLRLAPDYETSGGDIKIRLADSSQLQGYLAQAVADGNLTQKQADHIASRAGEHTTQ